MSGTTCTGRSCRDERRRCNELEQERLETVEDEAPTLTPEEEAGSARSLKVTYTEEAVADIVQAITYLNERNPTAAANLDTEIARCIERLADRELMGQSRAFARVLSFGAGACRRSGSTISDILTSC
jgi:plasmid stabilization system protein ParE